MTDVFFDPSRNDDAFKPEVTALLLVGSRKAENRHEQRVRPARKFPRQMTGIMTDMDFWRYALMRHRFDIRSALLG